MTNKELVEDMKQGMIIAGGKNKPTTYNVRISEANYKKASEIAKKQSDENGTFVSVTATINTIIANTMVK
jgi:hypothetical protein